MSEIPIISGPKPWRDLTDEEKVEVIRKSWINLGFGPLSYIKENVKE